MVSDGTLACQIVQLSSQGADLRQSFVPVQHAGGDHVDEIMRMITVVATVIVMIKVLLIIVKTADVDNMQMSTMVGNGTTDGHSAMNITTQVRCCKSSVHNPDMHFCFCV